MGNNSVNQIQDGIKTSFIDKEITSNPHFQPQFLSNDYKKGKKVLSALQEELLKCGEFYISVAFINQGGITPLLQELKELEQRGVKGKILTTDYLTFTEPEALTKLNELKNIELKMFMTEGNQEGFHTKGYIFRDSFNGTYRIIIGSSNLTNKALTVNKEWNTKIVTTKEGGYADSLLNEFNSLWDSPNAKSYNDFFVEYQIKYRIKREQEAIAARNPIAKLADYKLEPNSMQVSFVNSVMKLKRQGEDKALLISATGTGKTYAAAFAVRDMNPQRMLFLVHREQIARQARDSFERVFDQKIKMGIISGNEKNFESQFIFSTMQMMAKPEVHEQFLPDEFDVIVIDEVHRAGASSYQTIMEYFKPKFYLGMTASPDRTDDFDIYGLFDHNIAHEIRLNEALEEDLLCPFHYFGITDFGVDDEMMESAKELRNFRYLADERRVEYIIEKIQYFGHSGDRVKGLVFCSNKKEARTLSEMFNARGFKSLSLTGEDSQEKRTLAIERLTGEATGDYIDYIFTVDIFNEGVDIPEINQVVLLRPTESPIVFIQQLGRGLRKFKGKEFVVVIDFIGNYNNNYMIPMALFGDRSYNKDNVRRVVREGNRIIPGCTSINFDEISRTRIYKSIDTANFSQSKIIKEAYQQLRFKLGKIPSLKDFDEHGSIDVLRIFENKNFGSYHGFLKKHEEEYTNAFTPTQINMIEYISQKFASGKRPHELLVLQAILHGESRLLRDLEDKLTKDYGFQFNENTVENMVNILTGSFLTGSGKDKFKPSVFIQKDEISGDYRISEVFRKALEDSKFRKLINELVEYGFERNQKDYGEFYKGTPFNLYAKYTYEDVCRLLEWDLAAVALNIGGYKHDKKTQTYPVFINYDKEHHIADTIKYEDRFINTSSLIAISKSGRRVESQDVQTALRAKELGIKMDLFVRKNKDDEASKEFYYLGKIHATGDTKQVEMANTNKTSVEIHYKLETPVREDLYDYIVE